MEAEGKRKMELAWTLKSQVSMDRRLQRDHEVSYPHLRTAVNIPKEQPAMALRVIQQFYVRTFSGSHATDSSHPKGILTSASPQAIDQLHNLQFATLGAIEW